MQGAGEQNSCLPHTLSARRARGQNPRWDSGSRALLQIRALPPASALELPAGRQPGTVGRCDRADPGWIPSCAVHQLGHLSLVKPHVWNGGTPVFPGTVRFR